MGGLKARPTKPKPGGIKTRSHIFTEGTPMRLRQLSAFTALAGVLVASCQQGTGTVSGLVSYDGKPIPDGYLVFQPVGPGKGFGVKVSEVGSYQVTAPHGKYIVRITAEKLIPFAGGTDMYGEKVQLQQYIPEKYNVNSTLAAEIPAAGPVDFDLKSK
jgi:hypothetical protein